MRSAICICMIIINTSCGFSATHTLPPKIHVGYLYSPALDGAQDSGLAVISLAEKKLKENGIIPLDVDFEIKYAQIPCDRYSGAMAFVRLEEDEKIDAMMGPPCSPSADVIGRLAVSYNTLCISHLTDDYQFVNIAIYQTYARTTLTDVNQIAGALYKFLILNGWNRVAIISREKDFNSKMIADGIRFMLKDHDIVISADILYDDDDLNIDGYLKEAKQSGRVIIPVLGRTVSGTEDLMLQANKAGMTGGDYAWVFCQLDDLGSHLLPWQKYDKYNIVFDDPVIKEAYKTTFIIDITSLKEEAQTKFIDRLKSEYITKFPQRKISEFQFTRSQVQLFDATYAYGVLLNETVEKGIGYNDGVKLFSLLRWKYIEIDDDFPPIMFDGIMDRAPFYDVSAISVNGDLSSIYKITRIREESPHHYDYKFVPIDPYTWQTNDNKPPKDVPLCGFKGELCIKDTSLGIGAWVAIALSTVLVIGLLLFAYKKKMQSLELTKMTWLIDTNKLIEDVNKRAGSRLSGGSGSTLDDNTSQGTGVLKALNYHDRLATGRYDTQSCHLFKYTTSKEVRLVTEQLKVLQNMKSFNHENLSQFIGMSVATRNEIIILWSCNSKKILRDVLENHDMPLDDEFLATFLRGVASGLRYLHHSGLGVHGNLTSETCSVDSRLVVKLSEFGMAPLLAHLAKEGLIKIEAEPYTLFHCAPEVMVEVAQGTYPGSKPADLYSLGMICYQIISRRKLFFDWKGTDEALIIRIQDSKRLPMTPKFPDDISASWLGIIGLIKNCWAQDPAARPTSEMFFSGITVATSQFRGNIIEKMILRMERYTNDLEKVVAERTAEVHEQQERAERLLQQMLPKSVADRLQAGLVVEPETYMSATILFTDIVRFTDMASKHTAIEIVTLLNSLYSKFDDIIDQHNVYKVETIGDSYMVVSGIPNRIEGHVGEIASLGIALRDFVRGFDMPYIEEEPLRIRLGAHSGSVATGVVGVKMPRYCLFGDTVNMASRMESNSIPMRLHVSESCKKLLEANKNFDVVLRGTIEIQGKGTQTTYFVERRTTRRASAITHS